MMLWLCSRFVCLFANYARSVRAPTVYAAGRAGQAGRLFYLSYRLYAIRPRLSQWSCRSYRASHCRLPSIAPSARRRSGRPHTRQRHFIFHLSSSIIKNGRRPPPEMSRTPAAAPHRYFWSKGFRFKGSKARTGVSLSMIACPALRALFLIGSVFAAAGTDEYGCLRIFTEMCPSSYRTTVFTIPIRFLRTSPYLSVPLHKRAIVLLRIRVPCLSRHSAIGAKAETLELLNLAVRRDWRTSACRRRP